MFKIKRLQLSHKCIRLCALFCSKFCWENRNEECKTPWACKRDMFVFQHPSYSRLTASPLAACLSRSQSCSFSIQIFERKRDCSQSTNLSLYSFFRAAAMTLRTVLLSIQVKQLCTPNNKGKKFVYNVILLHSWSVLWCCEFQQ